MCKSNRPRYAEGSAMSQCSIIIPVYNRPMLTKQCLDALLAERRSGIDGEIIVVDDASNDTTAQLLTEYATHIRTVTHVKNLGFAAACNSGAAIASGQYLLFLNNDTIPTAGWLEALIAYIEEHPAAAIVGSKLLFPNQTIQHAGVVICQDGNPRHLYNGFPADHPAVNTSRRFQVVTAACALFQREVFEQASGFDTAFLNGYEDVDLCLRIGERGHEIHYCHSSVLYHLESVSRDQQSRQQQANFLLYRQRWEGRVRPDDLQYYLEDGLLRISYEESFPIHLKLSPLLAVVDQAERMRQADHLLALRSRQVLDLLRDTIRLKLDLRAAKSDLASSAAGDPAFISERQYPVQEPRLLHCGEVRWMASDPSNRLISILLPVKNGAAKLRALLPRIFSQRIRDSIEIIAIDSGSTDDTVEVLRQFSAKILSIEPHTFNHGLTRNLLARYAHGDVLVFINQSTLPSDDQWLANLVAPLASDTPVAGVCSRILPHPDADRLTCKDGMADLNASPQHSARAIMDQETYRALSPHQLRVLLNFHTMSAAIRPQVLKRIPFRAVLMGEDLLWAREILEAGLKLQHEPTSVAFHSHHYSFVELLQRNFDDGRINREVTGRCFDVVEILPRIISLVQDDRRYLEGEQDLAADELESWRLTSTLRRTAQVLGQWLGVNYDPAKPDLGALLSLTERIKVGLPTEIADAWKV
jgi:GT2 family glycosyltransferase